MTTNKYSKFIVENITVGTPISNIVAAGNNINELDGVSFDARIDGSMISYDSSTGNWVSTTNILADSGTLSADFFVGDGSNLTNVAVDGMLDSAEILDLMSYRVDEVGVNQKQISTSLNTFVSPFNQTGDDTRSWNLNYTSATGFYIREKGDSVGEGRTELVADASGSGLSTGLVLTGTSFAATGTEISGNLKLAGLPTSDPAEAGLLWNDGGIPVFSGATAPSGGAGIDSADVVSIVDAPYVQARQTPQDFAYSSLTGAPTALSSFTNDTNYITAADIPATVDSDYVAARAPAASGGLDSAGVQSLIDADLIGSGINSVAIGEGASTPSADNTVAVGINAEAAADYAVSIGDNATVSHPAVIGIAIGRNTSVTTPGGVGGVAIGSGASVSDNDTLAIGRNTVASAADATAIGPNTTASGLRSIAIGNNVAAITDDAVTIGSSVAGRVTYDTTNDWTFGATVNAPAFVGDGSGLTGLPSGGGLDSAGVQGIVDDNITGGIVSVQIGPSTSVANALQQTVIGPSASSTGQYNVAIGRNATVQSSQTAGTAVGNDARVGSSQGGNNGVAVGTNARVERNAGTAIGPNAYVKNGDNATAVGMQANAWGASALALGHGANATSSNTIAIGTNTSASTQYEIDIRTSAAGSLTYDTTNDWTFGAGVTMTNLVASGATVVFNNLPTVDPVNAGQLWNDGGTLKVSAG